MFWHWSKAAKSRKDRAKRAGQKIACHRKLLRLASRSHSLGDFFLRKEGAAIMVKFNAFTGVGVAGMSRTLHVAAAATAHPAFWAHAAAGAAVAIPEQRKRRNATATGTSVDRGTT
jgi:hypothetical protein